MLKERRDKH
jgi:hypothetical protein